MVQFSIKPPQKKLISKNKKPGVGSSDFSERLNSLIDRIRILEERYTNLRTATKITEENMIRKNKTLSTEIKTILSDISELKRDVEELKDKIILIIKELGSFAKKEDVKTLQRYIELWQPLNFVTHNELQEVIQETIGAKLEKDK